MLSNYQLKVAGCYNIAISNVKKLVLNFFSYRKICTSLQKFAILFKAIIKAKKYTLDIRIQSITMVKACVEFNTKNE